MLNDRRRMSRGGLSAVSRYRMVAAAISTILVVTACNSSTSPAPSQPAAASVAPASVAPAASAASAEPTTAASPGTKFAGVNVNILTFNGPQVAEPLQRRAPDWEQLTGGHVN